MHVVEVNTGVTGYPALLSHVLRCGQPRTVSGRETLDAGPTTVVMHDLTAALPLGTGRRVSPAIAAAEAVQLVGAFSDPNLYPPALDRFREDDGAFWGAYGERVGTQLAAQVAKLREDPGSRRGVVTLWDPERDNEPNHRDYPCTVLLMLWLEGHHLQLQTVMRSQDVWLGTPYDWFQFVQLQWTLARALSVRDLDVVPGLYRHVTVSTHLYVEDVPRARELVSTWYGEGGPAEQPRAWQPRGIGTWGDTFEATQQRARVLGRGQNPPHPTSSEVWFAQRLVRRNEGS